MGEYENQYRALERDGDTAKSEIEKTKKEIKQAEDEIKECQKRISSLQQKRQNLSNKRSQQQPPQDGRDDSSKIDDQIKLIDKELSEQGDKITFLTGKIASLKAKQSENESKLNEIVNKLSTLKSKVSKEKADFDSSYHGIKSEATQIKSKDSSSARRDLDSSASKSHSMYQKRGTNEKEIDSIINKYKSGTLSPGVQNYSGSFSVKSEINNHPDFRNTPIISISGNYASIDDKISNINNSKTKKYLDLLLPASSIKDYIIPKSNTVERQNNNLAEQYYYYQGKRLKSSFNPYYKPYTKSILNNQYRKYDYYK